MESGLTTARVRGLIEEETPYLIPYGSIDPRKLSAQDASVGQVLTKLPNGFWGPSTVSSGGGSSATVVTINTNTTISDSDGICLVTGSITVTLPPSPVSGQIHEIKDAAGTAGSSNITVAGNGHTIDGAASQLITSNYESMRVVFNSQWYRI